jgi:hypothetical protein
VTLTPDTLREGGEFPIDLMGNVGIIRHISPFSLRNAGAFSFQVDG